MRKCRLPLSESVDASGDGSCRQADSPCAPNPPTTSHSHQRIVDCAALYVSRRADRNPELRWQDEVAADYD